LQQAGTGVELLELKERNKVGNKWLETSGWEQVVGNKWNDRGPGTYFELGDSTWSRSGWASGAAASHGHSLSAAIHLIRFSKNWIEQVHSVVLSFDSDPAQSDSNF